MENGKLDAIFSDTHYVLLRNTANNSFELVNIEDGSKVIKNVKHLRQTPMVMDFDVSEPSSVCNGQVNNDTGDVLIAETAPAVEVTTVPDPPVSEVITTRKGCVIIRPIIQRDLEKKMLIIIRKTPLFVYVKWK